MSQFKTYVLSSELDTTAPIFQRVNKDQRVRLNKIPWYTPYMQVTFVDADGKNRVLRYKANSNTPWQDEQIKAGILANERYTSSERNDLRFTNGVLVTNKPGVQNFLENHPAFKGFKGICDEVKTEFELLDKAAEIKSSNEEFKKRAAAAYKISQMTLSETKEMLIRLNGSFYKTSDDIDENIQALVAFLDATDEEGMDEILKDGPSNIDENVTILLGTLINGGVLSFEEETGIISKKKGSGWIEIRKLGAGSTLDHMKDIFSEFLNTADGKTLKDDLEAEYNKLTAEEGEEGNEEKPKRGRKPVTA